MTTHVLVLCTHNSARSVLGEAMLNHLAARLGKDVQAHSAGSAPSGRVNPLALEALARVGIDTSGFAYGYNAILYGQGSGWQNRGLALQLTNILRDLDEDAGLGRLQRDGTAPGELPRAGQGRLGRLTARECGAGRHCRVGTTPVRDSRRRRERPPG